MTADLAQFVAFFKALADENRLKIVGLLAHQPHSVEELAANLGVSSATVSHHLQRLQRANLVQARVQQYYNVYALQTAVWQQMTEQLLSPDAIRAATPAPNLSGYTTRILGEYLTRGKLKRWPSQLKKREVILRRLAEEFEPGKRYPEKRVNAILETFYADSAMLRRELVANGWLTRNANYYSRAIQGE